MPSQQETTFFADKAQLFEPHLLSPSTLVPDCISAETARRVLAVLDQLAPEPYIDFVKSYYRKGLENFGEKWIYADINTVLYAICKNLNVQSYLEIGVRRGRSMSIVASQTPECKIVGFDMWVENYCGVDNPGKDLVQQELNKFNFKGDVEFIDGDSRKTVQAYFKQNPDAYFDLITVDGDHSIGGAKRDIRNVIPRLKIGGILVFDDICSHEHPYLKNVWHKMIENNNNFQAYTFTEIGLGIGFAIRRS